MGERRGEERGVNGVNGVLTVLRESQLPLCGCSYIQYGVHHGATNGFEQPFRVCRDVNSSNAHVNYCYRKRGE